MKKKIVSIVIVMLLLVGAASAQKTIKDSANSIEKAAFTPFGISTLPRAFSSFSLSSFLKEGVNGKIELQAKLDNYLTGGLSVDQKIGKNANEATPLSLTGISPGTTVKFNLTKMWWDPQYRSLPNDQQEEWNDAMQSVAGAHSDVFTDWRTVSAADLIEYGNAGQKAMAVDRIKHMKGKNPFSMTIEAGFTKTSFTYSTDSAMLTETKDAFITPTITLSLIKALGSIVDGYYLCNGYIALSYNFSENYNAADEVSFSVPFGATNNYYSKTLAFGKPEKKRSNNIMLEARKSISINNKSGGITNIAIATLATLDLSSEKFNLFLPIYFIRGKDDKNKPIDGLQGGIRFGYITSTEPGMVSNFKDGFTAQLIITEPLDFLKKLGL